MSVKISVVLAGLISFLLVTVTVGYAINTYSSASQLSNSHGAISIAFDDNVQDQYDYAFPLMRARGIVGTFYVVTDHVSDFSHDSAYMSIAELLDLQTYRCEIGSHSKTHNGFVGMSESQIRQECSVSKQVLQSYGFTVDNFAYPYGGTSDEVDSVVRDYYSSARSAYSGPYIMQFPISQFRLPGEAGETGDANALSQLESMVDEVYTSEGWAIIFFHHVIPNPTGNYQISTQDFGKFLDYVIAKGVTTLTVNEALNNGSTSEPSTPPPSTPPVSSSPTQTVTVVITLQPFGMTTQYTLNSGVAWTAPQRISMLQREWTFTRWSDGSTDPTRTFTSDGNYEITYS